MDVSPKQLKAFLLDSKLVDEKYIQKAEKEAKKKNKKLRDTLLEGGKITEEDLSRLEAYILGIQFINLQGVTLDPKILYIIPEPIARAHNIIAYKKTDRGLEVAMLDPSDLETINFIKKKTDLKILPRLTSAASITYALRQYQKSLEAEFGELIQKQSQAAASPLEIVREGDVSQAPLEDLKKLAEDVPIIKIVDTLLRHAILQRASDIHIEPMEKEVAVRYRIDGILHDAMILPHHVAPAIIARIKVLSNLRLDEHRLPQDGRFKVETPDYKVSFRVSILPVYDGEKAVLRLLPETAKGFTLERLGFHGEGLEAVHKNIRKPTGMILATGPTGSGKTTTLYTILEMLSTPGVNISTIEDPIEYRIPRINQTQVRPDIGFSFATGLRSLVRQDPDIIMVGEIRDNETASLAVNAALTGHLVLSTLHTNSAAGALPRLLDMKVEPFLIASTVNLIIAQRLVRMLCKEKEPFALTDTQLEELSRSVNLDTVLFDLKKERIVNEKDTWKTIKLYKAKASSQCPDGFEERIGIHESLVITPAIKDMIVARATSDEIEKQGRKEGMMTMLEDGIFKCVQGFTTIEEVFRVASE